MELRGLPKLLRDYLRDDGGWVRSGALCELVWLNPKKGTRYMPAHVDRKLRLLREHGILEVQGGKTTLEYRLKPKINPYSPEYGEVVERDGQRVFVPKVLDLWPT